jgi:hypothetical protein
MWSCVLLTDAAAGEARTFSTVDVVPVGPDRDLMTAVDAIGHSSARTATGHVLVAAPAALSAELGTALTVAAGRWPDLRLARLASTHAPLAILSALALARATTEYPAFGVRLVESLLRRSWSGAWTSDVARLVHPAPTLAQHARSLLPGAGFLVRQAPEPGVLGREAAAGDVPAAGLDRVLLVEQGAVPAAVVGRLERDTEVTAVRQVEFPGSWRSVYGTDRAGQLALVPARPAQLLGAVSHRCPACGHEQSTAVCPFCRVIGHSLVSVAHPSPGPPPPTPRAGLPITGLAGGVPFTAPAKPAAPSAAATGAQGASGGAGALSPPPAAGAAR